MSRLVLWRRDTPPWTFVLGRLLPGVVLLLVLAACSAPGQLPPTPTALPPGTPLPQPTPMSAMPALQDTPTPVAQDDPSSPVEEQQAAIATRIARQLATIEDPSLTVEVTPTAEVTPTPFAADADFFEMPSLVGLVLRDSELLSTPGGSSITPVSIATRLDVFGRTADGAWYAASTETGHIGWIRADQLRVYGNEDQLAVVEPGPLTGIGGPDLPAEIEGAAPDAAPIVNAIVNVERLNVRAGPGTDYPVIGGLQQNATVELIGRNQAGDWLQVAWPARPEGYGWIYAPLVTTSVPIENLPVSTEAGAQPIPAPAGQAPVTAAPAQASPVAGLQGTLVFQERSGGTIYRYNMGNGRLASLTHGADPAVSPDGRTVAFVRGGGETGVYLINIDGSNERRIFGGNRPASPKWSPDGQAIVFNHITGEAEPCRDTGMFGCIPQSQVNELLDQFGDQLPPDFSLDRWPLIQLPHQNLSRIDPDGGGYRDLAGLQTVTAQDWGAWGIVYQSRTGLEITEGADLSITRNLVDNARYQDPDWQPNGERIVFQSQEGNHWQIFSINSDGRGIFALTRPPGFAAVQPHNVAPTWSPDGEWIVFLSNRTGEWALWVMQSDGSNQQQLPVDLPIEYSYQAEQVVSWGP
jgi:uncharacterized protein YraI